MSNKPPFRFKPTTPSNGRPATPKPPTKEDTLRTIPADEWPDRRDQFAEMHARQTFNSLPSYQIATPLIMPAGKDAQGNAQMQLHTGLRVRDRVAVDLLAASISARVVQKGVLGALTAIPPTPEEMISMVRAALQMADIFVQQADMLEKQDYDTIHGDVLTRLDTDYVEANMPLNIPGPITTRVTTRVIEE